MSNKHAIHHECMHASTEGQPASAAEVTVLLAVFRSVIGLLMILIERVVLKKIGFRLLHTLPVIGAFEMGLLIKS